MAFSLLSRQGLYRSIPRSLATIPRLSIARAQCRKINNSSEIPSPVVFNIHMPTKATQSRDVTLGALRQCLENDETIRRNSDIHDTALVLTSPGLARLVCDNGFLTDLVKTISCSPRRDGVFNLLVGVADRIAGHPNKNGKRYEEGIAVCRGNLQLIPNLWKDLPPKQKEDSDATSALQFLDFSGSSVTLPLSNTIFNNNKQSTLIAAQYDISGPSPKLIKTRETYTQDIILPADSRAGAMLPLTALTPSREVTQSFGNIVRAVECYGKDTPASTELEAAVENIWKIREESDQSPFPMYAFITPEGAPSLLPPDVGRFGDPTLDPKTLRKEILQNNKYFDEAIRNGGRLYQLLSGGGGWGKKKGLLSLDPQTSHFSLSEEDQLANFFQAGADSGFAPVGSSIQFFAPHSLVRKPLPGPFTFGVVGPGDDLPEIEDTISVSVGHHFVALSNKAVFLHSTKLKGSILGEAGSSMKLSVPDSRVFLATGRPNEEGTSDLGATGLLMPDAMMLPDLDIF
ncbi:unnamed protein product [Clonostachys rosea f. rosea IK726]|uniref:FIST domain-containing protein n=2 Tax=Bionectria ochroleuca TaxID=29856 RepID=A0A0B7JQU9_BIOOC|nr:unnamed protein product [Clonostachys rosea f. rosea IK726]